MTTDAAETRPDSGCLHRQHDDLLDRRDDADQQERLGEQFALGDGGPDGKKQLDDDEDQQESVEDLECDVRGILTEERGGVGHCLDQ